MHPKSNLYQYAPCQITVHIKRILNAPHVHPNYTLNAPYMHTASTNSLASVVVQFVHRACGKLNLAAIICDKTPHVSKLDNPT